MRGWGNGGRRQGKGVGRQACNRQGRTLCRQHNQKVCGGNGECSGGIRTAIMGNVMGQGMGQRALWVGRMQGCAGQGWGEARQ